MLNSTVIGPSTRNFLTAIMEGLITIINIGDDADTNGAICGAYSGINEIKPEWINKIRETNHIDFEEVAEKLIR